METKDKQELINQVYFTCKTCLEDLEEIKLPSGKSFFLDEGNETLQVFSDGTCRFLSDMSIDEQYEIAKKIKEWFAEEHVEHNDTDTCRNKFEQRLGEWYQLTADCQNEVFSFLKKHGSFDIDLPNDFYFIISLERKVVLQEACLVKNNVMVKVSYPMEHDGQTYDWYDTMISWDDICQDPIILSDFMHEFYAAKQNMEE